MSDANQRHVALVEIVHFRRLAFAASRVNGMPLMDQMTSTKFDSVSFNGRSVITGTSAPSGQVELAKREWVGWTNPPTVSRVSCRICVPKKGMLAGLSWGGETGPRYGRTLRRSRAPGRYGDQTGVIAPIEVPITLSGRNPLFSAW